jgi:hypothetical protein
MALTTAPLNATTAVASACIEAAGSIVLLMLWGV